MENIEALSGPEMEAGRNAEEENRNEAESENNNLSMQSLLEAQEARIDLPMKGEVRQGTIAAIRENEILVSIGAKSEGVISGREFENIPLEERNAFRVGDGIPVYVVAMEDANGNVVLSYTRAMELQDWEKVDELMEAGEPLEGRILSYNKGGLIVGIGRLRGFVPASQISLARRAGLSGESLEERFGEMKGEPIKVRVIEVDRERRRLILSERLALQESREAIKDRLLEELKEGDIKTGRITSLANFGAFVNIDGADGLVHLSEISWERIQHPNEVLKVGQEVQVKVISIDTERKRIGLSLRQLQEDPWLEKVRHLKEGMLVEGTITHITKFGAFARLSDDIEGLIHVSELSEQRVAHPKEVVKEGQVLTLRIIKIDPEHHRIGLSLRKVDSPAYADLDWKMALESEVVTTAQNEAEARETPEEEGREIQTPEEPLEGEA